MSKKTDIFKKMMVDAIGDEPFFDYEFRRYSDSMKDIIVRRFRSAIALCPVLMYCGYVYCFNGQYYERLTKFDFDAVIEYLCDKFGILSTFWSSVQYLTWSKVKERMIDDDDFSRSVVCFSNGVVDFRKILPDGKFELMPFSPNNKVFFKLPYSYNTNAKCPIFTRFIQDVMPDTDTRMNLQEMCGCLFLDSNRYKLEKMAILYGGGANGKSVFASALTGVLGDENVSYYDLRDLTTSSDRDKNIMFIKGRMLNYCMESDYKSMNSTNVKSLISREPMHGRALYGNPEIVKDLPMIFINTNNMPVIKNDAKSLARRYMIYPFNTFIPKEKRDISLSEKLKNEYSGILNWYIEGMVRFIRNGYKFTESELMQTYMDKAFESHASDNYGIDSFIKYYEYEPSKIHNGTNIEVLHNEYTEWAYENNLNSIPLKALSRALKNKGIESFRKVMKNSDGTHTETWYRIIKKI